MQYPETISAIGPHQQQCILSLRNASQGLLHIARALYFVAIDFQDNVSLLQSRIIRGASRLHLLDHGTVNVARRLQLVAQFGSQVAQANAPAHLALTFAGGLAVFRAAVAAHRFQRDRNRHALAVAQHRQVDFRAGLLLSDHYLQVSRIAHLLSVDLSDDVADLQAGLRSR